MSTMKPQEGTSSVSSCSYHVFLSFSGEDTGKTFTDHLYNSLDQAGFHTFRGDDSIEKGKDIKSELEKAIQESRISIVVFSKSYASSTRCLEELVMILKRRALGHMVLPIFYHVDPSEVRKQNGSFQEAFTTHEEKVKSETSELEKEKLKDKVETWRAALREAANVAGMNLQNQVDGHEARFIKKIIKVVEEKLRRHTSLNITPHLVGMRSRVERIQFWLEDGASNFGIVAIYGMGGIGKTTTAKFLYNYNFSRFEGCSFIADVREVSKQQDGLLLLQKQFLTDICKTKNVKLNNIAEGGAMIKDIIRHKKVLVVLDDVDKRDQLDALVGAQDLLFPGSKIIITTRRERLLGASKFCKVHRLENLSDEESLELFSWHAFGKCCPDKGYEEVSKRAVSYCEGLPLAIEVIGSSLSGFCLNAWKSQLDKLSAIPNSQIIEKLQISYHSLQDDHDRRLFLHLACFFIGSDKDSTITILDGCEFYTVIGIQNLVDRCLISIDGSNRLGMHNLLQQMGREIVQQESPREPGRRSILWNNKDTIDVLRESTGTSTIEGLKFDMFLLKEETSTCKVFGDNRKRRFEEFLGKPFLSNLGGTLKRHGFTIFSQLQRTDSEDSNLVAFEVNAFASMNKLKLLQLNHVKINGPYKKFPKGLRWLCWRGFPLKSIPSDFALGSLVALDMQYSGLKNLQEGSKILRLLKVLNLSHSYNLAKTPNFIELPKLERLVLKNCTSLVEVHESIGTLERLVLLNLEDCKSLRKLPRSICMLKNLETLVISGCSSLDGFSTDMRNMESLAVLEVDGIALNQSLRTNGTRNAVQFFFWPWQLKPRENSEILWPSLPLSLVKLSLAKCNLWDDDFPKDLSNLCSLRQLDLSSNQFHSLPDFIRGLSKLESLTIRFCPRLRQLVGVPELPYLYTEDNEMLEEVTYQISHQPTTTCRLEACRHPETLTMRKLEFIGDVDAEIVDNLGLSNLQSMENLTIKLTSYDGLFRRRVPLQVCYEPHIICAYVPGSKVPPLFDFKEPGSSIDFIVSTPSHHRNSRIRGLNVCAVFKPTSPISAHTVISNRTNGLAWIYNPEVFGTTEDGEDTVWLSYWKFANHLEDGDKINISIHISTMEAEEVERVKEVGVRLLYKEVQEEMSSQSAYEENVPHPFGNIVPGIVSADQPKTKLYPLGELVGYCKHCVQLHPGLWTRDAHDELRECVASRILVPEPFHVSEDPGRMLTY